MINSPADWKQCYSAKATCGTLVNRVRFNDCVGNSMNINHDILFKMCRCCQYMHTQVNMCQQLCVVYLLVTPPS